MKNLNIKNKNNKISQGREILQTVTQLYNNQSSEYVNEKQKNERSFRLYRPIFAVRGSFGACWLLRGNATQTHYHSIYATISAISRATSHFAKNIKDLPYIMAMKY